MEKYEHNNTPADLAEYEFYTAEYIRSLFTMFHPLQSYRYPATNTSSSYIPSWKEHVQSETRQNAARCLLNFQQVYAQNFSLELWRNWPRCRRSVRTNDTAQKGRGHTAASVNHRDYWELNRRRPSVIRRSIGSDGKCSSPREAVLEASFLYDDPEMKTDKENTLIVPNYPESEAIFIPEDPQSEHVTSPFILKDPPSLLKCPSPETPFIPNDPQSEHVISPTVRKDPHSIHNDPETQAHFNPKVPQAEPVLSPFHLKTPASIHKDPQLEIYNLQSEYMTSCNIPWKPRKSSQSTNISSDDEGVNSDSAGSSVIHDGPVIHDGLTSDIPPKEFDQSTFRITRNSQKYLSATKMESQTETPQATKREKKFKFCCFFCKKRFRWFSHWQAHERTHTGERPYKCTMCDRCFTRGDGLQAHMVIHATKKPHKCATCGKVFARKSMLERHVVEHTGLIPYTCDVCQAELLDLDKIEKHLSQHEVQENWSCQYCTKRFVHGRMLVRHIRAHTGEKQFPCTQCKMRFSKKSALIIHHRVHSGIKPYVCPDCGKSFSISGNLRRHLLIHTGERPYVCSCCKKRFNNKSHLARHVSSLHGK